MTSNPSDTPPSRGDVAQTSPEFESALTTPHEHEGPNNPPLWIIWQHNRASDGLDDGPQIDSICDSEESARYHLFAALENRPLSRLVYVERVPANHRFASSLAPIIADHTMLLLRKFRSRP